MITDCQDCDRTVNGDEIGSYKYFDEEQGVDVRYTLLRCPHCSAPLLASQETVGPEDWGAPVRIYPQDTLAADASWPAEVRDSYLEASKCLRVRALAATAVMCRRTLEEVCLAHGVKDKALVRSLEKLKEAGVIDERLLDWAHQLRFVGNMGAHGGGKVLMPDARDAVEFTKALIEYVFTYRARFEAFKARRSQPSAGSATHTRDAESD